MIRVRRLAKGKLTTPGDVTAPSGADRAWFEVVAPAQGELDALADGLGLHRLALDDALRIGHPPKLEEFGDHLFLIAHTPEVDPDSDRQTRKIAIFLAKSWVVTVLRVPLSLLENLAARVERDPAHYLKSPAFLAHTIVDTMTDAFEEHTESLIDGLGELEEDLENPELMGRILESRSEVMGLYRVVRGQRDVALALSRAAHESIPPRIQPYLRDVYDHIVRVYESLEGARDTLGAVRDAHMAAINNRLSEVMRVLTVIATIMMPLSLLAGVYGMNFEWMPGVSAPGGFWVLVAVMVLLAAGMLVLFKARRWL